MSSNDARRTHNETVWSSTEAEFQVMSQGLFELCLLNIILDDLEIKLNAPIRLSCGNKSSINIAHNTVQHD